ncbi:MAG: cobalamin-independent methionine synthase II family protein [SAR202 cluster bacterium]|nr:cobalamin-independent methionine synthase II family protein [SAR202 cluster bacterium]
MPTAAAYKAAKKDRLKTPFAAGVVGSITRPAIVRDILPKYPGEAAVKASRTKQMDDAVAYAIALQEQAGLDLVSDGEWRRHAYTHIIADVATGFAQDTRPGVRFGIYVNEPITVRRKGLIAEEAKFLAQHTDRATKVCVPSPYILAARLWDPEFSTKAYPTREKFIDDLVPILHGEIVELSKSGVDVIQIDEPDMTSLLDPKKEPFYGSLERDLDIAVAKINEVIGGVKGVRLAMHGCRWNSLYRGWHWEGGYERVVGAFNKIKVDQFVLEFSIPVAGNVSILKQLRDDVLVGLGSVDPRTETLDTPEAIAARVEEAMKYVDKGRLSLNPDCGFAPDIRHQVPVDECYAKMKNLAAASRILREKYA